MNIGFLLLFVDSSTNFREGVCRFLSGEKYQPTPLMKTTARVLSKPSVYYYDTLASKSSFFRTTCLYYLFALDPFRCVENFIWEIDQLYDWIVFYDLLYHHKYTWHMLVSLRRKQDIAIGCSFQARCSVYRLANVEQNSSGVDFLVSLHTSLYTTIVAWRWQTETKSVFNTHYLNCNLHRYEQQSGNYEIFISTR